MNSVFESPRLREVEIENIPQELKDSPHWVVWHFEDRDAKPTKPCLMASQPYYQVTRECEIGEDDIGPKVVTVPRYAKSDKAETWTDFNTAYAAYKNDSRLAGVGYVFAEDDPYCGIDLDHCYNSETSKIDLWAWRTVNETSSYSEISPSGTGVKIITKATLPGEGRSITGPDGHKREVYDRLRYFTVTGWHLGLGVNRTIHDRQKQVTDFYNNPDYFPPKLLTEKKTKTTTTTSTASASIGNSLADEELISRAMTSANGEKFKALWTGDSDYIADVLGFVKADGETPDWSRADQALCNALAFWCNRDEDAIDRLFRQSALYRDKWERPDYCSRTIANALESVEDGYVAPQVCMSDKECQELYQDARRKAEAVQPVEKHQAEAEAEPVKVVAEVQEFRGDSIVSPEPVKAEVTPVIDQPKSTEAYRTHPMTSYLWRGHHLNENNVTEAERIRRAKSILDICEMIPKTGILPNFLRAYLPTTDGNPLFGIGAGLSLIASVVNRQVWFNHGGRKLLPLLWIAILGKSGERKSTWTKYGESILRQNMPGLLLSSEATWAALAANLGIEVEKQQDGTFNWDEVRANCDGGELFKHKGCGTLVLDELGGWLKALDSPHNGSMKEILTSAYEGVDGLRKETKSQGCYYLPNPTINIIAASTPEWLANYVGEADVLGGWLGRWTFVISDGPDYDLILPDMPNLDALSIVHDELNRIRSCSGIYTLEQNSVDYFCRWAKAVEVSERVEAWKTRIINSVIKIAMLMQVSQDNSRLITFDTLVLATKLVDRLTSRLEEFVEEQLPENSNDAETVKVRKIIRSAGEIQRGVALKKSKLQVQRFEMAVHTLNERGEVREVIRVTATKPGTWYVWVG